MTRKSLRRFVFQGNPLLRLGVAVPAKVVASDHTFMPDRD